MASKETQEKYNASRVESYLKSLTDANSSGFSYLIAKDGLIIAKGGLGLANIENQIAPTQFLEPLPLPNNLQPFRYCNSLIKGS